MKQPEQGTKKIHFSEMYKVNVQLSNSAGAILEIKSRLLLLYKTSLIKQICSRFADFTNLLWKFSSSTLFSHDFGCLDAQTILLYRKSHCNPK